MIYSLIYAGIPFLSDVARIVRMPMKHSDMEVGAQLPPEKHQPESDLIEEINRLIPSLYLQDFTNSPDFLGRNISSLAAPQTALPHPGPEVRIGDWYYPTMASRWSVFRGLMTSSQVKAVLDLTAGASIGAYSLTMKAVPTTAALPETSYTVSSAMNMLPPRPLAEHGGQFDGLYLITLCDERYYAQFVSSTFKVTRDSTWALAIAQLSADLGIAITYDTIPAAYPGPEPDSQLWANQESAAALLDAAAYNLGMVVVRNLNGTYNLYSPATSQTIAATNRGNATLLIRTAGGDIFNSGTQNLKVGDLTRSRNFIVPSAVSVTYPKYVIGDDPVPHFFNSRYQNPRPTSWFEDSWGGSYTQTVLIASGGAMVSGLVGENITHSVRSTAKALYSGEINPLPINQSGLTALSMQIAGDYYGNQVAAALDEVYPGTLALTLEGIHDVIWTYSERSRLASTRVMRCEWNRIIKDMQHATPAVEGYSPIPAGMGGPAVAQTIRDSFLSGTISTTISSLFSGDAVASFATSDYLPTQNRWKGLVNNEAILFEGTSGGTTVGIVARGIDGTLETTHPGINTLWQLEPNTSYGVNLSTYEKMQFAFPSNYTSGGIQGANIVPQTQTVNVLTDAFTTLNGIDHYPAKVQRYDPRQSSGAQWISQENAWAVERAGNQLSSGTFLDGQLLGFSKTPVKPIYGVDTVVKQQDKYARVYTPYLGRLTSGNLVSGGIGSGGYFRVGNTITALDNGTMVPQDGIPLSSGDNLLFHAGRIANPDNGLWTVANLGASGVPFTLDRSTNANTDALMPGGCHIKVWDGDTQRDTVWELKAKNPVVLNTTELDFHLNSIDIDFTMPNNTVPRFQTQKDGAPVQSDPIGAIGGTLTEGTTYYYVVTALKRVGTKFSTISGTMIDINVESTASNEKTYTPAAGLDSVDLKWSQVTGATGYRIYRSTQSGTYGGHLLKTISGGATITYTNIGEPDLTFDEKTTGVVGVPLDLQGFTASTATDDGQTFTLTKRFAQSLVLSNSVGSNVDFGDVINAFITNPNNAPPLSITGIAKGTKGRVLRLWNIGNPNFFDGLFILKHDDTNSVDVNRIMTNNGSTNPGFPNPVNGDLVIHTGQMVELIYGPLPFSSVDRWHVASTGIVSLNGLRPTGQTFATAKSGVDFNIVSSGSVHTFNLPDADQAKRGAVSIGPQFFAGPKTVLGGIGIDAVGFTSGPPNNLPGDMQAGGAITYDSWPLLKTEVRFGSGQGSITTMMRTTTNFGVTTRDFVLIGNVASGFRSPIFSILNSGGTQILNGVTGVFLIGTRTVTITGGIITGVS